MKKYLIAILCAGMLCGCSEEQSLETVGDELLIPAMVPLKELVLQLPQDAVKCASSDDNGSTLYFCDDYSIAVQTLETGDLSKTVQAVCGYEPEDLTIVKTTPGTIRRYDWVYSTVGEAGIQVGRAAILDDGFHHYCVSTMADEQEGYHLRNEWNDLFSSVTLNDTATGQTS